MEKKKVTAATIIRTILLVLALTNQVLVSMGYSVIPIDNEMLEELLTLLFTIGAAIWTWWKNNSYTKEALAADAYMAQLKDKQGGV